MRSVRDRRGYALLAALVIVTLAGVLVAAAVTAVTARQAVVSADRGDQRARWALQEGLAAAAARLRLAPTALAGSVSGGPVTGEPSSEEAAGASGASGWAASWERVAGSAGPWPCVRVSVRSQAEAARDSCEALLELRAEPFARGAVVAGDAEFGAAAELSGTGLYCGGSVRGREWLRFSADDVVHGERWPQAAVHAAGGIWCAGTEVHAGEPPAAVEPPAAGEPADPLAELTAADTDTHTGEGDLADLVEAPEASLLAALREHAADPGSALAGGVLNLARLPAHPPSAAGFGDPAALLVVVAPQSEGAVRLVGERPAAWCPIAVVVVGDAVVGGAVVNNPPAETAAGAATLRGALVVCGNLRVEGPLDLEGHLFARRLATAGTMRVTVPAAWRSAPLPGLVRPVIVRLDGL